MGYHMVIRDVSHKVNNPPHWQGFFNIKESTQKAFWIPSMVKSVFDPPNPPSTYSEAFRLSFD